MIFKIFHSLALSGQNVSRGGFSITFLFLPVLAMVKSSHWILLKLAKHKNPEMNLFHTALPKIVERDFIYRKIREH
jgi:hypothetical protein